ncbi:MAG: HNH endonuclease signature motif containing protein [Cetobacterium sp.]|uniref:HNH endonuclease signature motif containing protein n=1 Tax=Bacteria TaxID=2 RepID=UPI002FC6DAF8
MSYITIKVSNGKKKTYSFKECLLKEQFKFTKKPYGRSYWEKKIDNDIRGKEVIGDIASYFKERGLNVLTLYPENRRSNNYRQIFLENNKGINGYYFCAYCGKILNEKYLAVDHIIPINKASKSKFLKWILELIKINDINDIKNLTPSCKKCNSRKASKTGFWIVRGLLGKYTVTWVLTWTMLIISVVSLIVKMI